MSYAPWTVDGFRPIDHIDDEDSADFRSVLSVGETADGVSGDSPSEAATLTHHYYFPNHAKPPLVSESPSTTPPPK